VGDAEGSGAKAGAAEIANTNIAIAQTRTHADFLFMGFYSVFVCLAYEVSRNNVALQHSPVVPGQSVT